MRKRSIVILSIIIAVLLLIILVYIFSVRSEINSNSRVFATKKVTISQYNYSLENSLINQKEITGHTKNELTSICEKIDLNNDVDANIALLNEVVIDFNNGRTIYIQLSQDKYCYLKDSKNEKLVYMPEGLLNYVKDILK